MPAIPTFGDEKKTGINSRLGCQGGDTLGTSLPPLPPEEKDVTKEDETLLQIMSSYVTFKFLIASPLRILICIRFSSLCSIPPLNLF